VLDAVTPPMPQATEALAAHRRILQAAVRVHDAILAALGRASAPVPAFLRRGNGLVVEIKVTIESGQPVLVSQAIGQVPRAAVLTEFLFTDLLRKVPGDPLQGLSPEDQALGCAVLQLVGDELGGLGPRLQAVSDPFLKEQVWPRIHRVRDRFEETVLDREATFARLRELVQLAAQAQQRGDPRELEALILTCASRFGETSLTDAERAVLRRAESQVRLLRRHRELHAGLLRTAPGGAAIEVEVRNGDLRAQVEVPARLLQRTAGEGWSLRGDLLEFAGGGRPWSDVAARSGLECAVGFDAVAERVGADLDLVLPPAAGGRRLYVVDFRSAGVVVVLSGDNRVHAALVDGDPAREEPVQRAFQRAMLGVLAQTKGVAIPGAVHRLSIDVVTSPARETGLVRVSLDGVELLSERAKLVPQREPTVRLHALQEISVRGIAVRGERL
jgi:hypothetical protein